MTKIEELEKRLSAEWLCEHTAIFKHHPVEEEVMSEIKNALKAYWATWIQSDLVDAIAELKTQERMSVVETKAIQLETTINIQHRDASDVQPDAIRHAAHSMAEKMVEEDLISVSVTPHRLHPSTHVSITASCVLIKSKKAIDQLNEFSHGKN